MKTYVNGRKVVRRKGEGKVVAAFPDVCMSPPGPPAGPIPVPYALTAQEGDLKQGTRTVEVDGEPVGVGDESYYESKPLGNEAATRSFGGSLLTHTVAGKTYFASWSMDVKAEGKGVLRHLDLTTSNHASYPGGTPPFPNLSEAEQLALRRVEEGKCPCCGEDSCPAAFQKGEEPLSLEEFYKTDTNQGKNQELADMRKRQKESCKCNGRAFPEAPCDVFRAKNENRYGKITGAWEAPGVKKEYRARYMKEHGVRLKTSSQFLTEFLTEIGREAELREAARASTQDLKRPGNEQLNKDWNLYKEHSERSKQLERINHLVPKQAGGCPTNPLNLQPQQTLCETCQKIDQTFTKWQAELK